MVHICIHVHKFTYMYVCMYANGQLKNALSLVAVMNHPKTRNTKTPVNPSQSVESLGLRMWIFLILPSLLEVRRRMCPLCFVCASMRSATRINLLEHKPKVKELEQFECRPTNPDMQRPPPPTSPRPRRAAQRWRLSPLFPLSLSPQSPCRTHRGH